jgi:predicted 3-demethylubiquinone-9 3-methyltransferase (glyoxalase superfamily)
MNGPVPDAGVTPFLMFEGAAEEALTFYVGLLPRSHVVDLQRYGPDGPGADGSIAMARLVLDGLPVRCTDSPAHHAFSFTPSMSLFVTCEEPAEVDRLSAALGEGGGVLMPVDDYGFSARFAWVNDRFGVSWQLNCP